MKTDDIARLLPAVFQRTLDRSTPLDGVLAAMESLHAPDESLLGDLDRLFDVRRAPAAFAVFLARWVHFDILIDTRRAGQRIGRPGAVVADLGALRELVAAAPELATWRGTRRGMVRFLRAATGSDGFAVDEEVLDADGATRPFHIRVRVPASAMESLDLVHKVVRMAKPAHVTYELTTADGAAV